MLIVDESVVINRPRKEVCAYVLDPANMTLWQTNTTEYDTDWDEQPAVGDQIRAEAKVAGRRIGWTARVTAASHAEVWAFESEEAPFGFAFNWSFEDTDAGTRLSVHGESPGFGGFFGKLTDPLVMRMLTSDARNQHANLKLLVEER
jgi:hypothetical protein